MEIKNSDKINWLIKYYVVEGKSFYARDRFTLQSIWTTKNEAIAEKKKTMNINPSDMRHGLRTRYRHRQLKEMEIRQLGI